MKKIVLISLFISALSTKAQSVSLLNKPLNDAIRRAQLWGDVPVYSSFCVRPVNAVKALGYDDPYSLDSKYDFFLSEKIKKRILPELSISTSILTNNISDSLTKHIVNQIFPKNLVYLRATPITTRTQYNGHHDYGWQDGPMIPNKGLQYYLNAGFYGKIGPIEFQYAPEMIYAENRDLPAPGVRSGDIIDRFGTDPYSRSYSGQSYVKLNLKNISCGLSSENIFWGPGRYAGITMTENAPGINHLTIETNKPIQTSIGSFEFNLIGGKKRDSGFSWFRGSTPDGSSLPEIERNYALDSSFNVFSGGVAVFNPNLLPGFSIGISRQVWTDKQPLKVNYFDYVSIFFQNPFKSSGGGNEIGIEQMASLFFRYVMKESHAEVYGEYGFDDNRFDLEDMIVSPEHSRAYLIGFRKIHPLLGKKKYFDLTAEVTQIESSKESMNRIQFGFPVFYDSDYIHFGQNLGAGIGPGSNQWILNLDYVIEKRRLGFVFERIVRNNDNLYRGLVPWVNTWYGFDFTKKYTELSLGLNYQYSFGPMIFWAKALGTQTYNWNYWYDPDGSASVMRANGYNVKSLNIFTGLTLLL